MATVIYVNRRGTARLDRYPGQEAAEERARVAALLRRATPPARVSPQIIAAPARLYAIAETPREAVMTENGPRVRRSGEVDEAGSPIGDRVRLGDAFDVMEDQARRQHARRTKGLQRDGRDAIPFEPPFTVGQVNVAREYAALVERCAASGVKCSSLEALKVATGGGGDREAAVFRDFQRLRVLQRRIGDGLAKEVRRIRPAGQKRSSIRIRTLVDQVCLGGSTMNQVMAAHGWANDQRVAEALMGSLRGALDRMQGFDLERPQDVA